MSQAHSGGQAPTAKRRCASLAMALLLAGCASVPPGTALTPGQQVDPWEGWNRKVFAFNDAVDNAVLKPVAQGYQKVVPRIVRTGVSNVFGNLGDVWSTANQFLQAKLQLGLEMGMRVLVNTVFGLGGLLDPATEMGLTRRSEDFGQTLGRWGLPPGPYLVLPLFGPSTVRDGAGLVADLHIASPSRLSDDSAGAYEISALKLIDTRANLLSTTQLVDEAALDRYSFIRDAYLQRRLDEVYDGAPPLPKLDDESDTPAPGE